MPTIEEILSNKELGDDLEISLGDSGSFKLGDLRGMRTALQTERDSIANERDSFRSSRDELLRGTTKLLDAAGSMADDEGAWKPADPRALIRESLADLLQQDDPADALYKDPHFGKALTRAEERAVARAEKANSELRAEVAAMQEKLDRGMTGLAQAQMLERAHRWYGLHRGELPVGTDGQPMSLEAINKFAVERNMAVPGTQLVDFDRALETLTEPQRAEARMTEAEKRGYQKGLEAGRMAAGKVIPLVTERSAGGLPGKEYSTAGKSARQMVSERLQQGLADIAAEAVNE